MKGWKADGARHRMKRKSETSEEEEEDEKFPQRVECPKCGKEATKTGETKRTAREVQGIGQGTSITKYGSRIVQYECEDGHTFYI